MNISKKSLGLGSDDMMYDSEVFAHSVGTGVDKKLYARIDLSDNKPTKFIVENFESVYPYDTIDEAIVAFNEID